MPFATKEEISAWVLKMPTSYFQNKTAPILGINFFFPLHNVSSSYKGKMTTATTENWSDLLLCDKGPVLHPYQSFRV